MVQVKDRNARVGLGDEQGRGRHSEWEATTIPGLKAREQTVLLDLSESWGSAGWIAPRELVGEGGDPYEKQGIGKR